jgi:signal transduction histidine kinase/ActR/RegA family two-component response regulator
MIEPNMSHASISDLTAQELRERLQEAEETLAAIPANVSIAELHIALDAAGMGSWELQLATGAIRRSLRHDQIFGHPALQPAWNLETALSYFVAEDRLLVEQAIAQAKLTGSIDIEARIVRAGDRERRSVHIRGKTFYSKETPVRIAGVIADVTHRREVEERLRQTRQIEALGQLTGGVAHDFNNLLQVIFGGLQMMGGHADSGRRERMVAAMKQAVERGAGLCRQLLAFSGRQALRPEAVDLRQLIRGMRELLDRSLRGDVKIQSEFAHNLWPVEVDPGELELVILNLALNARDAMPSGGSIRIIACNASALSDQDLDGDFVRLDITDTGTGMQPEVLAHAFEPFFTTKEVGKGSGLGLAQTHGFARSSGGAVRIDSAPGRGTTVSLFLPRTHKLPALAAAAAVEPAAEAMRAEGQVLVVEDDDEVAALTVEMIHQLGYDTTRVASAEAALGALADKRAVDIVFSDVMMPGSMNGVELAQEIRRRRPNLPVLLTSGYAESARRSADPHRIKIISKPYRMEELRDALVAAKQDVRRAI